MKLSIKIFLPVLMVWFTTLVLSTGISKVCAQTSDTAATANLPIISKAQVMEWVNAAKQHYSNLEVDWEKSTQYWAQSNGLYIAKEGNAPKESVAILTLGYDEKNNVGYDFVNYNGLNLSVTAALLKIGITKFSSKAHVEYGGYKMRPEDNQMCHYFYIWDVGAKGFIVMSFPGKFTPDSKIETTTITLKSAIKDGFQVMVVDWLGKDMFGYALFPGLDAKDIGTYFVNGVNTLASSWPLDSLTSLGISTVADKSQLGYFDGNTELNSSVILYFPSKGKLNAIQFFGQTGGIAIVNSENQDISGNIKFNKVVQVGRKSKKVFDTAKYLSISSAVKTEYDLAKASEYDGSLDFRIDYLTNCINGSKEKVKFADNYDELNSSMTEFYNIRRDLYVCNIKKNSQRFQNQLTDMKERTNRLAKIEKELSNLETTQDKSASLKIERDNLEKELNANSSEDVIVSAELVNRLNDARDVYLLNYSKQQDLGEISDDEMEKKSDEINTEYIAMMNRIFNSKTVSELYALSREFQLKDFAKHVAEFVDKITK